jgi:hypothetical protein
MDAITRQGHSGSHRLGTGPMARLLLSWVLLGVAFAQQPEIERARELLAAGQLTQATTLLRSVVTAHIPMMRMPGRSWEPPWRSREYAANRSSS